MYNVYMYVKQAYMLWIHPTPNTETGPIQELNTHKPEAKSTLAVETDAKGLSPLISHPH